MPAPDVFDEEGLTPFTDTEPVRAETPYRGILYATDRAPGSLDDPGAKPEERFYKNDRGYLLRLGLANIELGEGQFSWEEARRISLAKNRTGKYPLKVIGVEEFGILDRSFYPFAEPELLSQKSAEPGERFAEYVNRKLAVSNQKDIFIYVHGYKVVFDNPVLVAAELWHYLGYEGAFIAYAWPSTPSRWAYFADAETTTATATRLRLLLEYLADTTSAERIHIVGYSQGTRLVIETLYNLALKHHDEDRDQVQRRLRIGNVILIGSDIDRGVMGSYIDDGLLKIPEHLTVYVSEKDAALGLSRLLLGRERLGEMFDLQEMPLSTIEFLEQTPEISVINVTGAAGATRGSGHSYFRSSPWVSSDMLMTLRYNLRVGERGLVEIEDKPIWRFPADYLERLRNAIKRVNPALGSKLGS
jgi:esterase/lipase superfamily enzyme